MKKKFQDQERRFTVEVDTTSRICHEVNVGRGWKDNDVERLMKCYKENIFPLLTAGGIKSWGKVCDLSSYTISTISHKLNDLVAEAMAKGFSVAAVVTDNLFVKMQMERGGKEGGGLEVKVFMPKATKEIESVKDQLLEEATQWVTEKLQEAGV